MDSLFSTEAGDAKALLLLAQKAYPRYEIAWSDRHGAKPRLVFIKTEAHTPIPGTWTVTKNIAAR